MMISRLRLPALARASLRRSLSSKSDIVKDEKKANALEKDLVAKIKFGGPMSIAQYMQEVLTNPARGYYTTKSDVIGKAGDFVTSPEVSQMFGESIAIWILHEWQKMGAPKPLQLVELGPGHGTLMQDIIRTIFKLIPQELEHMSVHLVEASPTLKKIQEARLCGYYHESKSESSGVTKQGLPVNWYSRINEVPKGFSFFIANEFFDALPIYKFVRDNDKSQWQEILVDITKEGKLCLVRSKQRTLACQYVENDHAFESMEAVEVSPKSGVAIQTISQRIVEQGGALLVADYGYDNDNRILVRDTLRAFAKHKLVDPLEHPGEADLTADVDFGYLRRQSEGFETLTYGPIEQGSFLSQLGIRVRCDQLKKANPDLAKEIDQGLSMLVEPDKMGARFKFFAVFPKSMSEIHQEFPPAGFNKS